MKKLMTIALLSALGVTAHAQNQSNQTASGSQTVNMLLSNAIELTFTSNSSNTGPVLNMEFTTVNDYANGIESPAQELRVRSTKQFTIAVRASAENFSYTGNASPTPVMPVAGVLWLKVPVNNTGGTIPNPFSSTNYAVLRDFNQNIIEFAPQGDKTLTVQYQATPGFDYPAGAYTVDVIYTATQI